MKKYKQGQLYYFEWLDANGSCDWLSYKDCITKPYKTFIKEYGWIYNVDDEYVSIGQWGDNVQSIESPVVKYFLDKYPPINI